MGRLDPTLHQRESPLMILSVTSRKRGFACSFVYICFSSPVHHLQRAPTLHSPVPLEPSFRSSGRGAPEANLQRETKCEPARPEIEKKQVRPFSVLRSYIFMYGLDSGRILFSRGEILHHNIQATPQEIRLEGSWSVKADCCTEQTRSAKTRSERACRTRRTRGRASRKAAEGDETRFEMSTLSGIYCTY